MGTTCRARARVRTRPSARPDRWPQLDLSTDYNDVSDKAVLDALATAVLREAQGSVQIPEISIRLSGIVPPALLGRTARIRITDEWHPTGLDARYRIVGVKVRPAERGRPDTAELALEAL
ncbi:hypothetical protein [Streptomyces anthocyanicus]|uniref:hypothetical protein n=1 Tax=Streptomyces anthocyanicus TaxID=68174 RepID=UPI00365D7BF7